jgi:apolipoprotein N-acyltransferase
VTAGPGPHRYRAAIASAILLAGAHPPLAWRWLAWVALLPWFHALVRDRGEGHRGPGYAFGAVHFLLGCGWLFALHPAFPLPLAAYLACYPLLFAVLYRAVARSGSPWAPAALPLLWVAVDVLREHALTGFPWLLAGHAAGDWEDLRQAADLGGHHLLSLMIVLPAAAAALLAHRFPDQPGGRRRPLALLAALAILLPAAGVAYGRFRRAEYRDGPGPRILLVQPDFPQTLKKEAAASLPDAARMRNDQLALSLEGLRQAPATDLVVWAETMIPGELREKAAGRDGPDGATVRTLNSLADPMGVVPGATRRLLAGAILRAADGSRRNAALLVGPRGLVEGRFDKEVLTPFGEYLPGLSYLPDGWRRGLEDAVAARSPFPLDLVPGPSPILPLGLPGREGAPGPVVRLGGLVCYEVIFPGVARRRTEAGADVLACLSNYGWYGDGAKGQVVDMTRLRAVECRRPILAATNDGPTLVVDGTGAIRATLEPGTKGVLRAEVPLDGRRSPWVAGGHVLPWAAVSGAAIAVGAGLLAARRGAGGPKGGDPGFETS